ncbi:hypothetical protein [Bacillus sp. MRMR6]|uniref:hypothetical protein n=1 Tax=Bacillus sp. MRMR6 TaxID=1928617 RepID=UPI00158B5651|nr:hypothetical protein [Bacillus sp. MRMR6]
MKEMDLSELEERIRRNNEKYTDVIDKYSKSLDERGLNKGRQRPKDPDEHKILDSFKRK